MMFHISGFLVSILALTATWALVVFQFRSRILAAVTSPTTQSVLIKAGSEVARLGSEVPPPSNVKVICNNFHTMVYWNYSKQLPHTSFTLTISGSSDGHFVFVTDELQYNLTWWVWASAQHSMDLHSVKISAKQGERQSQTVEKSFTFNDYNTADVKCYLDLPPLSLSVKDLKASVNVVNPLHVYEELKLLNSPLVEITVHLLNVTHKHREMKNGWTIIDDNKHTSEFCFPEDQQKYCIELEGRVFNDRHMYRVLFRNTGPVCALPAEGNSKMHTAILVGGAVIGGGCALAVSPLVLAGLGFTSAGITAGTYAASMMSSWAIANGGGVLAGSLVAFLQSAGVVGSAAWSAVVGVLGTGLGGAASALVDWWYSSSLDCRALSKP